MDPDPHLQAQHEQFLMHSDDRSDEDEKGQPRHGRLHRWYTGWKFTLSLAAAACILVLSFNLGFLLWAVARHQLADNRGVLYEGDCDRVKRLSTGLHLLINVLSTTLLGASNYGMQCLCAPTRRDIDQVHKQGSYLDIGVPSLRNLSYIPTKRTLLWICLALSSLPLHLVYNSTIFSTTAAYPYTIFAGHDSLGTTPLADLNAGQLSEEHTTAFRRLYSGAQNGSLEQLDGPACVNAYATTFQTKHGDLLLVTDNVSSPNQYDYVGDQMVYRPLAGPEADLPFGDPYGWMCQDNSWNWCSAYLPSIQSAANNNTWVVYAGDDDDRTYRVDACLAVNVPKLCKLQYSLPLTIVVIAVNAVKAVILCYMAVMMSGVPILTTGDAVASFLHKPDKYTRGRCLLSAQQVQKTVNSAPRVPPAFTPLAYTKRTRRRHAAASRCQWATISVCWLIAIVICIALLIHAHRFDGSAVWDAEFGSINAQALIKGSGWPTSLISNTMIANTPQLLFSILYFSFNSIMTAICLATEWSSYALTRKPLRVSWNPQSHQRSSYFLSLPYRYALPLMLASAILHWLISQSLFLVGIEAYDLRWRRSTDRDLITCGYNPVAVVSSIAVAVVMLGCLVWMGFRKFSSGTGIPIAGSCSLAMAVACHPRFDANLDEEGLGRNVSGERMEYLPLQWGAVPVSGEIGHCTFTSEEVEVPEEGRIYQ
ncbi:uncharacterized protein DSM5745_06896 [Aspergillus mulundensis]|uniref:DUF6536 domain-containing protein n=1 Tax=Aspergillus mulundensis TaxID=1810919 RepID=A0A3D8RSQ1_9EURO|nr:hypothetical protein DSM5745_06896 [Aspergillus mulundensis]RDW76904.1 hypothetical protein DSM5745_06896 [Aspergillus mulundensis]